MIVSLREARFDIEMSKQDVFSSCYEIGTGND